MGPLHWTDGTLTDLENLIGNLPFKKDWAQNFGSDSFSESEVRTLLQISRFLKLTFSKTLNQSRAPVRRTLVFKVLSCHRPSSVGEVRLPTVLGSTDHVFCRLSTGFRQETKSLLLFQVFPDRFQCIDQLLSRPSSRCNSIQHKDVEMVTHWV